MKGIQMKSFRKIVAASFVMLFLGAGSGVCHDVSYHDPIDSFSNTRLHRFARDSNVAVFEALECDACSGMQVDVDATNDFNNTALHEACDALNVEAVAALLRCGAKQARGGFGTPTEIIERKKREAGGDSLAISQCTRILALLAAASEAEEARRLVTAAQRLTLEDKKEGDLVEDA